MRILLISPLPPPAGGIATWTKLYIESNVAKENKIDVVNTSIIGNRVKNFDKRNMPDEIKRTRKIWQQLKSALIVNEYDVVHINISCSKFGLARDYLYARVIKKKKVKIVIHCHCDTKYMVKGIMVEYFFKRICSIADKIFCLNTSSQNHIGEIANKESIIIPNFFEEKDMNNICEKNITNEVKNIIYVGHIVKLKGCIDILSVARQMLNINFKMIGYLSDEIKSIPISDNVEFLGEISKEEVLKQMIQYDLLLFPSHTEGFPNTILEAMACGLPIIATPVGAIPDILEDNGGLLVNIGDVEGMIKAINILHNSTLRQQMSKWNKEKVKKAYSVDVVMKKIFEEYARI